MRWRVSLCELPVWKLSDVDSFRRRGEPGAGRAVLGALAGWRQACVLPSLSLQSGRRDEPHNTGGHGYG